MLIFRSTCLLVSQCFLDLFSFRSSVHRDFGGGSLTPLLLLSVSFQFLLPQHRLALHFIPLTDFHTRSSAAYVTVIMICVLSSFVFSGYTQYYKSNVGASIAVFAALYSTQLIVNLGMRSMRTTIIGAAIYELVSLS